jgi:hypothetical protein
MNQGPPSPGRPLPVRIINCYNSSAVIVVDINRVHEIGAGPSGQAQDGSHAFPLLTYCPPESPTANSALEFVVSALPSCN